MDSILLTGSTGFIGSNLARYWHKKYDIWHILRKSSLKEDRLFDVPVIHTIYWEDIINHTLSYSSLPPFTNCYHLAVAGNSPGNQNILDMIQGNVTMLIHLMDFCKQVNVHKLVHFSSWSEYGDHGKILLQEDLSLKPDYVYGASKTSGYVLGRAYAQSIGLPFLTFRLFSLFGPYDKPYNLIPTLIKACLLNLDIKLTQGLQQRDFLYLGEIFSLLDIVQEKKETVQGVFNVCTGTGTTLKSIGETIIRISGKDPSLFKWGAKPYRPNEAMYIVGDPTKTVEQFGWKPKQGIETHLQELFDWYEAHMEWLDN